MIDGRAVYRSTMMADVIYQVAASPDWISHRFWNGSAFFTKSISLERNLLGSAGTLKVGYYVSRPRLYVTFSGTDDLEDWFYNTDTSLKSPVTAPQGLYFHGGFCSLAEEVLATLSEVEKVLRDYQVQEVYWSGHSAGGAVAGIIPHLLPRWKEKHFTIDFGTPRYMSSGQSGIYPRLRFQNIYDIVPCIPMCWRGPFPAFSHYGQVRYTLPTGKMMDAAPWYRVPAFILKHAVSLLRGNPRITEYHSMSGYHTSVLRNYLFE